MQKSAGEWVPSRRRPSECCDGRQNQTLVAQRQMSSEWRNREGSLGQYTLSGSPPGLPWWGIVDLTPKASGPIVEGFRGPEGVPGSLRFSLAARSPPGLPVVGSANVGFRSDPCL